jgi:hypothetical protein
MRNVLAVNIEVHITTPPKTTCAPTQPINNMLVLVKAFSEYERCSFSCIRLGFFVMFFLN